jgi:Proto-chlorophyllide reductase 57 kD subunit
MSETQEITWTPEADESVERAPVFLRSMVRKLAEKKARELGLTTITAEHLTEWKNQTMGAMGGLGALQKAAEQIKEGHLPWTQPAKERLETVPVFMRAMVKQIAEEIALERGHLEVNVDLLQMVESLGEVDDSASRSEMTWTDGARQRLERKIEHAPAVAMDFVFQMLKRDAEDLARQRGYTAMTEEVLTRIWDSPMEEVKWSEEAWRRLQTAPDFVRSGIKKAAERRARKLGVTEITSNLLTTFRNEAMMKAVMRIRKLGFNELTFDAFEAAAQKTKRLQGNEQAKKRLEEIRAYMVKKPNLGTLGAELMGRFRKYLKGEGKL